MLLCLLCWMGCLVVEQAFSSRGYAAELKKKVGEIL